MKYQRTIAAFVAALAGIIASSLYLQSRKNTIRPTPHIAPYTGSEQDLCKSDRVEFSPHGRYAVFTAGEDIKETSIKLGQSLAILDFECADAANRSTACINGIMGLDSIRALSWSKGDESLYVVENGVELTRLAFASASNQVFIAERLPLKADTADTLVVLGPVSSNSAISVLGAAENNSKEAGAAVPQTQEIVASFVDDVQPVGVIAIDRESLKVSAYLNGIESKLNITWPEVRSAKLLRDQNEGNRGALYDYGALFTLNGRESRLIKVPPFSLPLIDSRGTGNGWMRREGIEDSHSKYLKDSVAKILRQLPDYYVKSAASTDDGRFVALLRSLTGAGTIVIGSKRETREIKCDGRMQIPAGLSAQLVSMGTLEWPLQGLHIKQRGSATTVIFFGGGPTGSSANNPHAVSSVRKYLERGFNVLIVNYSSSTANGSAVSGRLREYGTEAFRTDAEKASDFVSTALSAQNIFVHGESFGALPALELSAILTNVHALILFVPLIKYREPSEWMEHRDTPFRRGSVIYQKRMEDAVMGMSNRRSGQFQRDLDRIYSQRSVNTPAFIGFATLDPVSKPEDLTATWRNTAEIALVKGTHELISSGPELWGKLDDWMTKIKLPLR